MNYNFPNILHIDDIRSAIEGRDEFIIAERDWGYVVNYVVAKNDTFPPVFTSVEEVICSEGKATRVEYDEAAAIRRECRGLIFDQAGNIMARRLHKFFNINEREETLHHSIDLSQPHIILEKLDGSMITPIQVGPYIRWATKMGITDVSMNAEVFIAQNPHYVEFADREMDLDHTPIFEWCSNKNKIVVEHPKDRLVLLAIRENVSGKYLPYETIVSKAEEYGVDYVKAYPGTVSSMQHLIDTTRSSEGIEGWIIRFDSGHMVKIKGDWYVRIHKNKDLISLEKNLIELIVNEKLDDVLAFLDSGDRDALISFQKLFWEGFDNQLNAYTKYYNLVKSSGLDKKSYAQNWMPTIKAQDSFAPSIVFGCFDGKDIRTMMLDHIRKNIGTQHKVDSIRYLWGDHKWNYGSKLDD